MPAFTAADRRRLGLLLVGVLALVFWDSLVFWPLRVLVVVFHELGHALAAVATGGEVLAITVSPDEGGRTLTRGGVHFLVLNGGYLGSLAAGLALLGLTRSDGRGRPVLLALAAGLVLAALAWFRPVLSFGFAYTLLVALAAGAFALRAPPRAVDPVVRAIGLFSVLYAAFDVRSDVLAHGFAAGSVPSDAAMLAELTHVPALIWGLAWLLVGGLLTWRLRRWVV